MTDVNAFIQIFVESLEELPAEPLTADTRFKDLKSWDSLAVLTVSDSIDMEYGVLLKRVDYQNSLTLGELHISVLNKQR
jgi:acyl carrier protein